MTDSSISPDFLTILHTNDFHNHLTPEAAAVIRAARETPGKDVLLLDGGDAISAGNVGVRLGGEPILTLMSETGYDAMTLGNREFHVADAALRHKIANATFPVLCANMRYKDAHGQELPVKPYVILTTGSGLRVAVMGLTVPMVTARMSARHISAFLFDDPFTVALEIAPRLRNEADVAVLMSHAGYSTDLKIARMCPDLDLIIGAHTHLVLEKGDTTAPVPIVEAGSHGRYFGHVELRPDDTGRWRLTDACLIPLKSGTA